MNKIHKSTDKTLKLLSNSFTQGLFDLMGVKTKVGRVLDSNLLTRDSRELIADLIVKLIDNTGAIVEFQNSYITREVSKRFNKYIIYASEKYGMDFKLHIIYTAPDKINIENLKPAPSVTLNAEILDFKYINGDEIYRDIKNKIDLKEWFNLNIDLNELVNSCDSCSIN